MSDVIVDAAFVEDIRALIEANGKAITFTRKARTPADAAKPWNGPSTDPMAASPAISYSSVRAVRDEIVIADAPANGIRSPLKSKLYVSASSFPDGHVDVTTLDNADDGTHLWKICYVEPIAPGDIDVIYEMGLEG